MCSLICYQMLPWLNWIERSPSKRKVVGSSPIGGTKRTVSSVVEPWYYKPLVMGSILILFTI